MSEPQGILRAIAWRDFCPWLIIFRSFRLSLNLSLLLVAGVAASVSPIGWRIAANLFLTAEDQDQLRPLIDSQNRWPWHAEIPRWSRATSVREFAERADNVIGATFLELSAPMRAVLTASGSARHFAFLIAGVLWMLLVWGLAGGIISRTVVVRLGREERSGLNESARFAAKRLGSYFAAPLFPIFGVLAISAPLMLAGFLMRADVGVLIAGLGWVLVLAGGFGIAWFLVGLLFGWPLMLPAISAEETGDAFEALHRSFSYVYQRPLHYLFYAVLAIGCGLLGSIVVSFFCEQAIGWSFWAVSWGAGNERLADVLAVLNGSQEASGSLSAGTTLIALGLNLVRTLAVAFRYSFFWCAASAMYLLLRRDVDQTEFDEIYMEGEAVRYELPSLKTGSGDDAKSAEESAE